MENTNYVGLSYAVALSRKMDVIANNIANVDTAGFKSSHNQFEEYIVSNAGDNKPMSMVQEQGTYRDFAPGPLQQTGNVLDVALQGNGFMAVQTPDGEKYTRNGSFSMDATGQLVTSFGMPVAGSGGGPIIIPAGSREISIAKDGTVSTEQGQLGRLKVVRFDNPQDLSPVGNSMFEASGEGIPDPATTVQQGMIEGSNVNSVKEMTDMIEVLRNYQSVARMLQNTHDSEINMISKLSKI